MNKNSIADYAGYFLLKAFGPLVRLLPPEAVAFLGAGLGEAAYRLDHKHRAIASANVKIAFPAQPPRERKKIVRTFYRTFGQNFMEMFLLPRIDRAYLEKYTRIEGVDHVRAALKGGRGALLVSIHAGSWELSNVISANLGVPFRMFVRDQRHPRLNRLLNSYRRQRGCRIIERSGQIRELIVALRNNEAVGMTADQGGRSGIPVLFFGKTASMPSGAVRLALKYDVPLLPVVYRRLSGPHMQIRIHPPQVLKRTGDPGRDLRDNLRALVHIFEGHIARYPHEYLWTYRIWKYSTQKRILILSDGITGHLRQAQALGRILSETLRSRGIQPQVREVEVKFKNRLQGTLLGIAGVLCGRHRCQGYLRYLRSGSGVALARSCPDIVISAGSSTAAVNYLIARAGLARSLVIMRPSFLSMRRFDLVVMPLHDSPPRFKNVVATEGALNLVSAEYLVEQSTRLAAHAPARKPLVIGALFGGDTREFRLDGELARQIARQIKEAAEKLDADILLTTSRRTSPEVEALIQEEFRQEPRCRFLVLANRQNPAFTVGGILGASHIVVTTAESISMVSEAASSGRYVTVCLPGGFAGGAGLGRRHEKFLALFAEKKYIYLTQPHELAGTIERLWRQKPAIATPHDAERIRRALEGIL